MKDLAELRSRKKISEDDKTILDMVYFVLEEPLDLFAFSNPWLQFVVAVFESRDLGEIFKH